MGTVRRSPLGRCCAAHGLVRTTGGLPGWRRPAVHALVALAPYPLTLWLSAGLLWPLLLVTALGVGAGAVALRRQRRISRQHNSWLAAEEHAKAVVDAVYEQWLAAEVRRGSLELDQWRRTFPR